jgi:hypothetical protein
MATLLPTNLYGESGARFIGTGGCRNRQTGNGIIAHGRDAFQCDVTSELDSPLIIDLSP